MLHKARSLTDMMRTIQWDITVFLSFKQAVRLDEPCDECGRYIRISLKTLSKTGNIHAISHLIMVDKGRVPPGGKRRALLPLCPSPQRRAQQSEGFNKLTSYQMKMRIPVRRSTR
ncbi:predicted protein [Coccidioides posadasii str. Silveira]|uniref:Predicted protein n=1 Tax=Coccidioides posadasii (strain RMSCC 757 / Silveira) TaxID=443226 RepID=E9DBR3_COCPS|nr:predicted protein [Coccidioides posadasii str. Silveira]